MPELRDVMKSGDVQEIWTNILKFVPWQDPAFDKMDLVLTSLGITGIRDASISTTPGVAGDAMLAGQAVYADGGTMFLANNTDPVTMEQIIGLVATDALISAPVDIITDGTVNNPAWTFVPGPVYIDVAGALTQVSPLAPAAAFLLKIGVASAATQLTIDFDRPILLVEETP